MTTPELQLVTNALVEPAVDGIGSSGSTPRVGWRDPLAWAVMAAMTTFNSTPRTLERLRIYLPESSTVVRALRSAHQAAAPIADQAQPAERIRDILRYLGLTKTQLKDACRVSRQTLYDWLGGRFEPEGSNSERLRALHELALTVAQVGTPLSARLVQTPLSGGRTFAQQLGDEVLDHRQLREAATALAHRSAEAAGQSARGILQRMGGVAPSAVEQENNQVDNSDSIE